MGRVIFKMPKRLKRVEIIKATDVFVRKRYIPEPEPDEPEEDIIEEELETEEPEEEILRPEDFMSPPPIYYREFRISDTQGPIEISMDKVPVKSMPLDQVKEAVQKAYDDGYKDGEHITKTEFVDEMARHQEWVRQFDTVTENMRVNYMKRMRNFEESVVELAVMISDKVLRREAITDENVIIEQVRKAFEPLDNEKVFRIHLHPDDVDILNKVKSELVSDSSRIKDAELNPNEEVERGGCVLETSAGLIDSRLRTQLNKIHQALDEIQKAEKMTKEQDADS